MAGNTLEFNEIVKAKIQDKFNELGLKLTNLFIENMSVPTEVEKAIDERSRLGVLGGATDTMMKMAAADAIREAAKNPGMGGTFTSMGVGLGAGSAIGDAFRTAMASNQQQQQAQAPAQAPAAPAQAAPAAEGAAAATKTCPECGNPVPAGSKFCPNCGAKMPEKKFCVNCGAQLSPTAKFCPECGTKQ